MGRKSRAKKEARRNMTEFVFSAADGREYKVTEIHPNQSAAATSEVIRKIVWSHQVNMSLLSPFLKLCLHKMPKKRVFLLNNEVGNLIVGFYPTLTELENGFLETLVRGLTADDSHAILP